MYRADRLPKGYRGIGDDASRRLNGIYIGKVKRNDDPQRMGRISVWVPEFGGNENDENNWFILSYASPFAGCTSPNNLRRNGQDMASSSTSYGFWAIPPDLDNLVLCCFAGGDPAHGFWIGCLYQQNMNHMVPGIPSNIPTDPTMQPPPGVNNTGALPPVAEYNRWSSVNPQDPQRPVYTPLHKGLLAQGLYSDPQRGTSSSGARREAPSAVVGLLSPGGNSFVMDDGTPDTQNSFIRLRTTSGVQILLNDTNGFVYIISGQGNSWVEISDAGVDIFTAASFSAHAGQDINLHANQNINMFAGQNITMVAGQNLTEETGQNIEIKAGANFNTTAVSDITYVSGANILTSAQGTIATDAGGNITSLSGGSWLRTASQIQDNGSTAAQPSSAQNATTPTLVTYSDPGVSGGSTQTVVSRLPTHEPWPLHPKAGVPGGSSNADTSGLSNNATIGGGTSSVTGTGSFITGSGRSVPVTPFTDNSPKSNINGFKISQTVLAAIEEASSKVGIDFGFMMGVAAQESAFNPNAASPTSSAIGLYQLLDATWSTMVGKYGSQYNVSVNDRTVPRAEALMGASYMNDNRNYLQSRGIMVGRTELYMAHFLGAGGACKFLSAYNSNPNQIAVNIAGQAAGNANKSIFYQNGTPTTCAYVYQLMSNKIVPRATAFANQYGTGTNPWSGPLTGSSTSTTSS